MGTLLEALANSKRRESAGSDTAARFDYQKNWALCEMLSRHDKGIEYLIAFEFHDDVLFLTPEEHPTDVDFFQVKTSKSPAARTIASFTTTSKPPSVVGKMVSNSLLVGSSFAVRLILVSNNPFEFSTEGISGVDIAEPHRKKLLQRLAKEFPGKENEILKKLHFSIANLPVDEMDTFVKGKAVELFEKRFGLDFSQNAMSWLRLIQGEIRRRNNYPDEKINTVAELLEHKCISRSLVAKTLDHVEQLHRPPPDLAILKGALLDQGWSPAALVKLEKAIPVAVADYSDPSNLECKRLADAVGKFFNKFDLEKIELSLLLDKLFEELTASSALPPPYRDRHLVAALGILIYHEKL